ncbi:MAG TPA: hypothetical protein VIA18_20420, partial [Polyangia bacterium]|nr:hypothetical protein [Polyangia bacterium]
MLFAISAAGCGHPHSGGGTPDAGAGTPLDLATTDDASMAGPDLAEPAPPNGLVLIAGGLGGVGSADATGTSSRFFGPNGVVADGAGNLYVADTSNYTIRKIVLASGVVTTVAGTPGSCGAVDGIGTTALFCYPAGLALDAAGHLYVSDSRNETIRQIDLASGTVTTLAGQVKTIGSQDGIGAAARFDNPVGLAFDDQYLYVADAGSYAIRKITVATGEVTTFAGSALHQGSADGVGAAAMFTTPYDVANDGHGNLFVADGSGHTVRQLVIATATVTTLAGMAGMSGSADGIGAAARFFTPSRIASDGNGNVYVADQANENLRQIVVA